MAPLGYAEDIVYKYYTRADVTGSDKHFSLLQNRINYIHKVFTVQVPCTVNLFK